MWRPKENKQRGLQPWETRRPYRQAGSQPGGTDALGSGAGRLAAAFSRALGEEGHPGGTWGLPLVSAPGGGWRPGLWPGLSPSRRTRPSRGPGCQAGKDGQAYMLRWEHPSERPQTPDWPGPRLHLLVGGPSWEAPGSRVRGGAGGRTGGRPRRIQRELEKFSGEQRLILEQDGQFVLEWKLRSPKLIYFHDLFHPPSFLRPRP